MKINSNLGRHLTRNSVSHVSEYRLHSNSFFGKKPSEVKIGEIFPNELMPLRTPCLIDEKLTMACQQELT